MDRVELKQYLEKKRVPSYFYNLDGEGRKDERLCLEFNLGKWNVYFIERGIRTINIFFDSEGDACQYLYYQLID